MKRHVGARSVENGEAKGRVAPVMAVFAFLLSSFSVLLSPTPVGAQPAGGTMIGNSRVPEVNIAQTPAREGSPFGGFKLVVCDGPDYSGVSATASFQVEYEGRTYTIPAEREKLRDAGYRPCNFEGLMIQAQFLINTMLYLGVVAAIIGFAYAGFKYVATPIADKKSEASAMFPKIFWGFIIMLTAWFIVRQILIWLTPNGSAYLQ